MAEEKKSKPVKDGPKAKPDDEQKATKAPEAEAPNAEATEALPAPVHAAPEPPADKHYWWGTGRRKTSVARVRIRPGSGKITINKRELDDYFRQMRDRQAVMAPLHAAQMQTVWDVWANVRGGGSTGQAGAVTLGLARAIAEAVPDLESHLRSRGLLTRDARMAERKKPGQPGARKRFQFSKR